MSKRLLCVLGLVLALAITACAAPAPPAAPAASESGGSEAASSEPFRVAIVMPSSTTDLAWSQAIYSALVAVQEEMGGESAMEIAYSENMFQVTDAAAAIRDYASEGYDLVIAHGTQYGNSMFEVAADFPETSFAWGTAVDTGKDQGLNNIFAYEAAADQGGYVNGVIAALLTKSGVIGVVGPVEAGDAKLYIDGFAKGVKDTNPDAVVNISYTGSFGDTALAAEAANVHIQAGADVLTGSAQQVVGAVGVAKEHGVYWLGTQSDQTSLGPEIVVANQIYDWTGVIKDMIAKIKAGELGGTAYNLTLENGGLVIQFNDNISIPDEVKAAAQEAIQGIIDGSITTME
ncbi:MAG: BMP family ABC transporter substrate-binding protein [Caldilineae bacterium]|nr:MAG: BMP family ABC transporter substrate-binding protein [Caldilineae bacterium]